MDLLLDVNGSVQRVRFNEESMPSGPSENLQSVTRCRYTTLEHQARLRDL